jgi:hypothetical protein
VESSYEIQFCKDVADWRGQANFFYTLFIIIVCHNRLTVRLQKNISLGDVVAALQVATHDREDPRHPRRHHHVRIRCASCACMHAPKARFTVTLFFSSRPTLLLTYS